MRIFKSSLITLLILGLNISLLAQTPSGINYQAVARDGSGNLLTNSSITVKAVIATGGTGSNVEYTETHQVTTSDYGLFTIVIGQGSTSDNFGALQWGAKKHHLKIELNAGNGFVNMGSVAFEAVPYALMARDVENIPTLSINDLSDVSTSGASNGMVLGWDGTTWKPVTGSGGGTNYVGGNGITITGNTIAADASNSMWNANQLQGNSVANSTPANGQVLKWNGSSWSPSADNTGGSYAAGTGLTLSGTTFSANTGTALWNASQLQGNNLANTSPSNGQVLKWNGSAWAPSADNTGSYTAGTGLTLTGTAFSANTGTALWNANKIQGNNVATTAPANGEVLQWNGTNWAPESISSKVWKEIGTTYAHTTYRIGIGVDSARGAFEIEDTIVGTGNANFATAILTSTGSTSNQATTHGLWITKVGRGAFNNIGIRSSVSGSATTLYNGSGAVGGFFLAQTTAGQNNFGMRASAGEDASTRNYGVYSHSRGNGQFNMGVFALADKKHNSTTKTNYGIFAWADSARTNYAGYFDGNVTYTGTLSSASDARLKTNILPLESALTRIENVEVATYEYSQEGMAGKMNLPEGKQIGFIAQNLEKSFPELVDVQRHAVGVQALDENPETLEYKAVNYIGMIPVLTKAIQEQQDYIEKLEQRIEQLETQMNNHGK
ncbi:tail fiber domain-containing protein [bacterium SCSIO 12741]|nr:tail fiber domain-containing protein [bacterium SCSIO 12741]